MTHNDFFQSQYEVEIPMAVLMRFNIKRVENPNGPYIFVEGSDDRRFYSATNISLFHTDLYFYAVHQDYKDDEVKVVGKDAVLRCYTVLKTKTNIGSSFKKCVFIVDRDYDENIKYSTTKIQLEDKKRISMTSGHSFENYFLDEGNLKCIFDYYGLNAKALKDYYEHFGAFSDKASTYFAACATITAFHDSLLSSYRHRYRNDDIFDNDILVDEGIDIDAYTKEFSKMMKVIQEHKECMEFYKNIKKEVVAQPALYIRGHNVFSHLEKYLAMRHRAYIRGDYRRIVRRFSITFSGYQAIDC